MKIIHAQKRQEDIRGNLLMLAVLTPLAIVMYESGFIFILELLFFGYAIYVVWWLTVVSVMVSENMFRTIIFNMRRIYR